MLRKFVCDIWMSLRILDECSHLLWNIICCISRETQKLDRQEIGGLVQKVEWTWVTGNIISELGVVGYLTNPFYFVILYLRSRPRQKRQRCLSLRMSMQPSWKAWLLTLPGSLWLSSQRPFSSKVAWMFWVCNTPTSLTVCTLYN